MKKLAVFDILYTVLFLPFVIFTLLLFQTILLHLNLALTEMCLNRYNMRHWNSPNLKFTLWWGQKGAKIKQRWIFSCMQYLVLFKSSWKCIFSRTLTCLCTNRSCFQTCLLASQNTFKQSHLDKKKNMINLISACVSVLYSYQIIYSYFSNPILT